MENEGIATLLIEDHVLIREGLQRAFEKTEFFVVAQAASLNEAIIQLARSKPKMILLDLNLPDGNGNEVIPFIRSTCKESVIVVLTMAADYEQLAIAKAAGATAYVLKSSPLPELLSAMRRAITHPRRFSGAASISVPRLSDSKPLAFDLTSRELEILHILVTGLSAREIGSQLFISEATVKTHLASLYRKLAVNNRVQAIESARKHGLLLVE